MLFDDVEFGKNGWYEGVENSIQNAAFFHKKGWNEWVVLSQNECDATGRFLKSDSAR
jgi:hypothetical protein